MSDTIIIRRNGEKFAVDCSTVLEAFNGHLKVKFDGIICPKCGASDSCWIPVRKIAADCARCGEWFCGSELNEDNLCVDCEEAEAEENKEGDTE